MVEQFSFIQSGDSNSLIFSTKINKPTKILVRSASRVINISGSGGKQRLKSGAKSPTTEFYLDGGIVSWGVGGFTVCVEAPHSIMYTK